MPYQITRDIYVYQSSIWQTNSTVILNEAANVVVDPCYFPAEVQVIADFVNRRRSFNKYIIFTHSDFDHIIGYQYFKDARLIGHEEITYCDKEAQLVQMREIDQTYYIRRKIPFVFPRLDVAYTGEYRIPLKDDELVLYHAPGHTGDGTFIVSKARRVLIAGDYLSDLEFPFVYFNTRLYRKTLDLAEKLVREYEIEYIVPGHGDIAAGQEEILYRINSDKAYLEDLADKAEELLIQGLQETEIQDVLREDIRYRDEKIDGAMTRMHEENIRQILKELRSF